MCSIRGESDIQQAFSLTIRGEYNYTPSRFNNFTKSNRYPKWNVDLNELCPFDTEMVSELRVPKIDKKPLEYVVWGKNLTLRCSVTFITGSSIHLNWTHPVKSIPVSRRNVYDDWWNSLTSDLRPACQKINDGMKFQQTRVVVSESTDLEAKTHTSTLTIVNVTKNDGGKYVCTAHDTIHHPTQDSYDIVIQGKNVHLPCQVCITLKSVSLF